MAAAAKSAARAFNEVVFHGKPKVVRALVSGLMIGAGRQEDVYYSFLDGVHHEGKAEHLAGLVGLRGSDCHLVVEAGTAAWLKGLARVIANETGLAIASNRRIRGASMEIEYHAFAQRYEDEIRAVLGDLPAGVRLAGFRRESRIDPGAKGIEAYSPLHEFEAKGRGTLTGPVDALIGLRRRLAAYPLVKAGDIELKFG